MTNRPIHVLLIEDNPGDIRLVRDSFQTGNGQFALTHVGRLDAGIPMSEQSPSSMSFSSICLCPTAGALKP